jgi:hypothetical protein
MMRAMERARERLAPARVPAAEYRVLERQTGRTVRGVACSHFGPDRCRLGDLKGPLCLIYLCEPARSAVVEIVGPDLAGADPDDFGGSRRAVLAVVSADLAAAHRQVDRLAARLARLGRELDAHGMSGGAELYRSWEAAVGAQLSSAQGSSSMSSTR